jgi:hypothetical protein
MKRYITTLAALLALSALAYHYQTTHGQQPGTRRDVTSARSTPAITETPKGKMLVEKLPEGAQGVLLEKGVVKAKPGYKFVKKDNQVTVMRIGGGIGGPGIGGSWDCNCGSGGGGCEVNSDDNVIHCRKAGTECTDKCQLSITIKRLKTQILQY